MRCVDLYNQSQSKWFEEMVTTSLVRNHWFTGLEKFDSVAMSFLFGFHHNMLQ